MKARNYLWYFSVFFFSHCLYANEYMSHPSIIKKSEHYLYQQLIKKLPQDDYQYVKITSRNIDSRLKLSLCAKDLTFSHRTSSALKGNVSIKVSCNDGYHPWSIHTSHKISLEKPVITLNGHLAKHHLISEQDLHYVTKNIYKLRSGYITDKNQIIGKQLKRPVSLGQPVYISDLYTPDLIKKGDAVTVVAKIGGLSVIAPGIALSGGHKGQQIDVENRRSSRVIRGLITGPNTVKVIL